MRICRVIQVKVIYSLMQNLVKKYPLLPKLPFLNLYFFKYEKKVMASAKSFCDSVGGISHEKDEFCWIVVQPVIVNY